MVNCWDIIWTPFPFTDRLQAKLRPAVVLSRAASFNAESHHVVLAMITTAKHSSFPLDVPIRDLESANLPMYSLIRMKLFTLDQRVIQTTAGKLGEDDRARLKTSLQTLMELE